MSRSAYDAVILGGGPAGATAGLMLASAGWRVAIVEASAFPRAKLCGDFVSATTLALLQELGAAEGLRDFAGAEVRRVGFFAQSSILTAPMPKASGTVWGRAVRRERLDHHLLGAAACAGAKLYQPWRAHSHKREQGRWVCRLARRRETREIAAPVLIIATGSPRRKMPSVDGGLTGSDLLAFKAYFRGCALPGDLMPLVAFPGGYGGLVQCGEDLASLSCCIRRDALIRLRRPGERAAESVLQHICASSQGALAALGGAACEGDWLAAGPLRPGMRQPFADGIFFLGNAAGEAHPIIAEGISMAVQSAWLLCRRLLSTAEVVGGGRLLENIGQEYRTEWRTAFALRIRAAALFAAVAMRSTAVTMVEPVLASLPGLLTFGAYVSGKSHFYERQGRVYARLLPFV